MLKFDKGPFRHKPPLTCKSPIHLAKNSKSQSGGQSSENRERNSLTFLFPWKLAGRAIGVPASWNEHTRAQDNSLPLVNPLCRPRNEEDEGRRKNPIPHTRGPSSTSSFIATSLTWQFAAIWKPFFIGSPAPAWVGWVACNLRSRKLSIQRNGKARRTARPEERILSKWLVVSSTGVEKVYITSHSRRPFKGETFPTAYFRKLSARRVSVSLLW